MMVTGVVFVARFGAIEWIFRCWLDLNSLYTLLLCRAVWQVDPNLPEVASPLICHLLLSPLLSSWQAPCVAVRIGIVFEVFFSEPILDVSARHSFVHFNVPLVGRIVASSSVESGVVQFCKFRHSCLTS